MYQGLTLPSGSMLGADLLRGAQILAVEGAVERVNGKLKGKREKEWNAESDRSEWEQNG